MSTITINSNKSQSVWAYLQLMRPANIITAWADIFLGYAAAGIVPSDNLTLLNNLPNLSFATLGWLIVATTGLYGGGVVFNDVCDAELDAAERPERPLPGGRASILGAIA